MNSIQNASLRLQPTLENRGVNRSLEDDKETGTYHCRTVHKSDTPFSGVKKNSHTEVLSEPIERLALLPLEMQFEIVKYLDVASLINYRQAAPNENHLFLMERLSNYLNEIDDLSPGDRHNLFNSASTALACDNMQNSPRLKSVYKQITSSPSPSLRIKAAIFCALVNEKILPNPNIRKIKFSTTLRLSVPAYIEFLSEHRVAQSHFCGSILINNMNEVDHQSPISLHLYDDPRSEVSLDSGQVITRELTNHRLIAASNEKARIWDLQSSGSTMIKNIPFDCVSKINHISEETLTTLSDGVIKLFDLKPGSEGILLKRKPIKKHPTFLDKTDWGKLKSKSAVKLILLVKQLLNCSEDQAINIIDTDLKDKFRTTIMTTLANKYIFVIKELQLYPELLDLDYHICNPKSVSCSFIEVHSLIDDCAEAEYEIGCYDYYNFCYNVLDIKKIGHIAYSFDKEIYMKNYFKLSNSPHILSGHSSHVIKLAEWDNGLLASLSDKEVMVWDLNVPDQPCIARLKEQTDLFYNFCQLSGGLILTSDINENLHIWDLSDLQHKSNSQRPLAQPQANQSRSPIHYLKPSPTLLHHHSMGDFCSKDGKAFCMESSQMYNFPRYVIDLFRSPCHVEQE